MVVDEPDQPVVCNSTFIEQLHGLCDTTLVLVSIFVTCMYISKQGPLLPTKHTDKALN